MWRGVDTKGTANYDVKAVIHLESRLVEVQEFIFDLLLELGVFFRFYITEHLVFKKKFELKVFFEILAIEDLALQRKF